MLNLKRKNSRRALKASVQELYIPQESEEITYGEWYDIDGESISTSVLVRTLLKFSLAVDLIQSYAENTASFLGMLTDNDKLSAIINKVITGCSIGEIIATICDVCEGSLDGKWF